MKKKKQFGLPIPGWIFLTAMVVYVEVLVHCWNADALVPGRFAAVLVFALGCGLGLGLIPSLFGPKAEKWIAVILGTLVGVLGLLEHFLNDAYTAFMPMHSVFAGAEGVATGYFDTIVTLLSRSVGRILLVMLPVPLYAVFARLGRPRGRYQAKKTFNWKRPVILLLAAVLLYGAGFGIVLGVGLDKSLMGASYNFDGAVRCFGVNVGMILEPLGGLPLPEEAPEFELNVPTQAPAEQTEVPEATEEHAGTTPPETTEPPRVFLPHSYDLDYAALAEGESEKKIANLHSYVASLTPAMENEYTGLFAGKNLIFITAEAFSAEVIDPELTPTLYRLATKGIQFTDYYQILTGCSTTGGEYTNLLGLVPYNGVDSMLESEQQYLFLTMGHQLDKQGYNSAAFHNNDHDYYKRDRTHTKLGYDTYFAWGNGMEGLITNCWPRSDKEMVELTLPEYLDKQPFNLYYMSVSGHATYGPSNAMGAKNFDQVEHLPYSKAIRYYLAANLELEYAVESIVKMLEEKGIADDTVIVIGSDHYPYGLAATATWGDGKDYVAELYGASIKDERVRDHNRLIIWSGCIEDMDLKVESPVYSLDILPTLNNLFGLEYDSRLLAGRDVFSEEEALVIWPLSSSWKSDKGYYNSKTGKFYPNEGVEVDEAYLDRINAVVRNKLVFCRGVASYNYYNIIAEQMNFTRPEA